MKLEPGFGRSSKRATSLGLVATTLAATLFAAVPALSAGVAVPTVIQASKSGAFNGSWSYRSFMNEPDLTVAPDQLLFGAATIQLREASDGTVSGTLGGDGWSLNIKGTVDYSASAATVKFEGIGDVSGDHWVYDYFGYLSPSWSNGMNQVPAIVGTVVRTVTHSGGQAPAGVVVSFYAVRSK